MLPDDDTRPVDPPDALRALDDVVAPDRLRLAVAAQVEDVGRRQAALRLPRMRLSLVRLAAALAVPVVVIVVLAIVAQQILGPPDGGMAVTPSVRAIAPVALRAPLESAPAARPGGELLVAQAGPIAFPTWTRIGWHAVGARRDTVRGHAVRTVFYADVAGRQIGYAIADAQLPVAGGRLVNRRGAHLRVLARGATSVVTWRRDGRTCILASRGVPVGRLLTLASYAA
ncbi:MAG TPA: hypothetical protein VFG31_11065 [Conexibacter sp.]|nr:hypothetical protein [Conexibacter sp.]